MLEYGQRHTNFISKSKKRETHNYCFLETNNPKSYALIGAKIKV